MLSKLSWWMLCFLAFGVAGYAGFVYAWLPLGSVVAPSMQINFVTHSVGIYLHIFAAILALVIGPFQFYSRFRQKHSILHRWLGGIYLGVGVLIGGVAGLYMSQLAYGGEVAQLGFATLALVWLYSGYQAFAAIRRGDIQSHRQWMVRNYALTFAAVTLRLYLPASMLAGIDFAVAYPAIAWLCWVPNVLFAEWYFNARTLSVSPA